MQRGAFAKSNLVVKNLNNLISDCFDCFFRKAWCCLNNDFFLVGFNAVPGLSTVDYVTVAVIEKYLDFKVREELTFLNSNFPVRPPPVSEYFSKIAKWSSSNCYI